MPGYGLTSKGINYKIIRADKQNGQSYTPGHKPQLSTYNEGGRVGYAQGSGPIIETEIKSLLATLRSVRNELKKLTLDDDFDFEIEGYVEPTQAQGQAQAPQAGLPETPGVNPALIKQVLPSTNVMETGLTPTEQALLSNEEKAIRLRQRGMTA